MAKALFRFLRGELNGFYITNLYNSLNVYSQDIKSFLTEFNTQQFNLDKMSVDTLKGLGKFASVFLPRWPVTDIKASLHLSNSHIVDGTEFSERGLYNINNRDFEYVNTDESITSPDINTLATTTKRSSLIGDEIPIGYIAEDETDVIDSDGNVKQAKVLSEPPQGKAYSEYYGNQFLFLSEGSYVYEDIEASLFIELFKALQWIRYNGVSIASFVRLVEIVCPNGLFKVVSVLTSANKKSIIITYRYNNTADVDNRETRLALLEYIVRLKFKQFVLTEEQN